MTAWRQTSSDESPSRSRDGDNRSRTEKSGTRRPRNHPGKRERAKIKARKAMPEEFADASRGIRIQKVLAQAGVGSKRACEELIESGAVRVNGHPIIALPAWVDPHKDHITVNNRAIKTKEAPVYIMLFKPRGVLSTNADPEGRPRAIDLVDHPSRSRLYPVGRLDMDSSGLLLLTNDGEMANRLTHPRHEVHKTYEIVITGLLDEDDVKKLEKGIFLSDEHTTHGSKPGSKTSNSRLKLLSRERDRTHLLMELTEGRNRQIRRMMADVGHDVKKLRRVAMGPLKLKGLQPGQWRELTDKELQMLKRAAKLED
jgi:pseudouridine synthase